MLLEAHGIVAAPIKTLRIKSSKIANARKSDIHKTIDELERRAVMAAGEILERYNVSRNRDFNPDHIETLARDAMDEVIAADAAAEPA